MTDKVIHISIDGLNSNKVKDFINSGNSTGFKHFVNDGLYTYNARTDKSSTLTLPNHTSMFTSMSVEKHGVSFNSNQNGYVINFDNIFDILKRNNKSSAMYVGKDKFNIYKTRPDMYYINQEYSNIYISSVIRKFIKDTGGINADKCNLYDYTFIHLQETDYIGHTNGWDSEEYKTQIADIDIGISKIIRLVNLYKNICNITIIATSDHGGYKDSHGDNNNPENFNIPFFVYHNYIKYTDNNIYGKNIHNRIEYPYTENPDINNKNQPIRNGDIGNLIAGILLGKGNIIKGSQINIKQNLNI